MKLNLKYVAEVINDDYKTLWNNGDVVSVDSQTGTGKTWFTLNCLIPSLTKDEKLIYVCNRHELEMEIKRDLNDLFNLGIVEDDVLDVMTIFKNVKVVTYQHLAENLHKIDLQEYKYLVMDEAHFWMTDSSFNNKCHLTFFEVLRKEYPNSIRIIISATMDEIEGAIEKSVCNKVHTYKTGKDYSYLDIYYFKKNNDILQLIKNDTSDEKWLIFVTSKSKGEEFASTLKADGVDALFVHAHSKSSGIHKNKFKQKVLISTKFLDNGVNIKDKMLKNIVVLAFDKTTFIQEIGRCRINPKDARIVKLYIPMFSIKTFNTLYKMKYENQLEQMSLYENDEVAFQNRFKNDHHKVYPNLFYLDDENKWKVNLLGYNRLHKDFNFSLEMINAFNNTEDEFSYIKKQLEWLEQEETFNESKLIMDVVSDKEVFELELYLDTLIGKKLFKDEQNELINKIDLRVNGRQLKSHSKLNEALRMINSPFVILTKKSGSTRFWMIDKNE